MSQTGAPSRADVVADVEVLARSGNRVRLLETLLDEGPVEKCELAAECDVVRTTLQRNLDTLADRDLIQECDVRTYELTPVGEEVTRSLLELVKTTHTARRLAPLLKWLPNGAFDLEVRHLADAKLVEATEGDPYAPVNRHVAALETADSFRGVLSVVGQHALETAYDRIKATTAEHELVVGPEAATTLREDSHYCDVVAELLETGQCRIYVSERSIPFYLGLVDDRVQIGVEDEDGIPRALVETDAPDVFEWAENKYDEYRMTASPLS